MSRVHALSLKRFGDPGGADHIDANASRRLEGRALSVLTGTIPQAVKEVVAKRRWEIGPLDLQHYSP